MFVPENRAAAPSLASPSPLLSPTSTTPNPHAMSDAAAIAAVEGNSRTLQGPSAAEWARHRQKIVDLYRQYPLKRVSEIMRKHYGFSASKRMYDKRFREWNVFKNANSDERTRAARRAHLAPAVVPPSPHSHGGDRDPESNFDQQDLRRTLHCARTIQPDSAPAAAVAPESSPSAPIESQAPPSPEPYRQPRRSISISDLLKPENEPIVPSHTAPVHREENPPQVPFSPPYSPQTPNYAADTVPSSPWGGSQEQEDGTELVLSRSPQATYRSQLQILFATPPRSLSPDPAMRTMNIVTTKLREYYDWQLENIPAGVLPDDYLGHRSPTESTQYWSTIKEAIYLVKISAKSTQPPELRPDRRAWAAFAEAGEMAAGAMTAQPFDFLRHLFATLSPINTSARPELRGILLQFLSSQARDRLSANHPITQICEELQRDQGCQEISQRSLQCMLDIFNSRLERSRAITYKLLDSLATLLRRSGDYQAGLKIVTELLSVARPVFGPNSDQVRSVENELAHFYMIGNEPDLALGHCMSVVTRPPPTVMAATPAGQPSGSEIVSQNYYRDGIAAHTMEDIAEIHERRGDLEQCIAWLERAAHIALEVWGGDAIATTHVIDKLTRLQRQFGGDLLRSASFWEAAVAPQPIEQPSEPSN
ncbi:hypothetical protein B0J18DRAFT_444901 [Chaetomium sp. MPI-SDFR-AT-0129]|nr:hypothetical protein B0J18DRAFT_444901 [Chaetomium sp. MPI-SDFR-AT-0129]